MGRRRTTTTAVEGGKFHSDRSTLAKKMKRIRGAVREEEEGGVFPRRRCSNKVEDDSARNLLNLK